MCCPESTELCVKENNQTYPLFFFSILSPRFRPSNRPCPSQTGWWPSRTTWRLCSILLTHTHTRKCHERRCHGRSWGDILSAAVSSGCVLSQLTFPHTQKGLIAMAPMWHRLQVHTLQVNTKKGKGIFYSPKQLQKSSVPNVLIRYNHTGTQFFEIKKSRPLCG